MSSSTTWDQIQANLTRQQYLPEIQKQTNHQQSPPQSNQVGGQMMQGQFVAQPQIQNTFSGARSNRFDNPPSQFTSQRPSFLPNNYSSQHTNMYPSQTMPTFGQPTWQPQSRQPIVTSQASSQYSGNYTNNNAWMPNAQLQTSSVGASPTPPQSQQMTYNRNQLSSCQYSQGASAMNVQSRVPDHRHFACEFSYNGKSCSLLRCLEDRCNIVQVNDGGYSQVIDNWLFLGPPVVKQVISQYANRIVTEERQEKSKFISKMSWLVKQPNSSSGVRIKDLAPPDVIVIAKITDMNTTATASPAGAAAASPSISPGVSQQHQQLSHANQAQLMTHVNQISQRQREQIAAQPQLAEENFRALQQQINIERGYQSGPLNVMQQTRQQQQMNLPVSTTSNGLPPVPPLMPRPDIASVAGRLQQEQNQGNNQTETPTLEPAPHSLPQTVTSADSEGTNGTRLQTVDDWDRYLASTGQSMLVIAPEPSTPDVQQDLLQENESTTNAPGQTVETTGGGMHGRTCNSGATSNTTNGDVTSVQSKSTVSNSIINTVIGTITAGASVPSITTLSSNKSKVKDTSSNSSIPDATKRLTSNHTEAQQNITKPSSSSTTNTSRSSMDKNSNHLPLDIPTDAPSVPEFVNLDLWSDMCLTPEKDFATNPLDNELKEKNNNTDKNKGKKQKKKSVKDTLRKEKADASTRSVSFRSDNSDLESDGENYKPFNARGKRKRNLDEEDEDYVPEEPSPEIHSTRSKRQRHGSGSSNSLDSDSCASESSLSVDSPWDSDTDLELPVRRDKRKPRRRRRVYMSDDESGKDESKTPNPGVLVHNLSEADVRKLTHHIKKRKFVSVKYSLHCQNCKLIKRVRKRRAISDSDSSDAESAIDENNAAATKTDNVTADKDTTVVSIRTASGDKEPIHEPVSDPETSNQQSGQECLQTNDSKDNGTLCAGEVPVQENDAPQRTPENNLELQKNKEPDTKTSNDNITPEINCSKDNDTLCAGEVPVQENDAPQRTPENNLELQKNKEPDTKTSNDSITPEINCSKDNDTLCTGEVPVQENDAPQRTPENNLELQKNKEPGVKPPNVSISPENKNNSAKIPALETETGLSPRGKDEVDKWQNIDDISDEDLTLLMNEFLCRKEVYVCKCGVSFTDQALFWLHKTNFHRQGNILACGGCSKVCGSQYELIVHHKETACIPNEN